MQGAAIPIIETPPERTWIWSDLHLADRSILLVWNRLFWSIEEMNRHLLTRWSERVGASDTIICLGDVGHPDSWRDRRLVVGVRDCSGHTPRPLSSPVVAIDSLPSWHRPRLTAQKGTKPRSPSLGGNGRTNRSGGVLRDDASGVPGESAI